MKKIRAFLLAISFCMFLTACTDITLQNTTTSNVEMPVTDTSAKIETQEDPFESFMIFPNVGEYFFGKVSLQPNTESGIIPFVFFRVIDVEEEYSGDFTVYRVQLVDMYGIEVFDTEKVYRMGWRGHIDEQLYGRPPLEVGKIYGRFLPTSEKHLETVDLWQAGLIYGVEDFDGKRYVYGYGVDLSLMKCKIPITDPKENSIYKQGKHDQTIAALQEFDREIPTFDYKAEAEELYKEYNRIMD